MCSHSSQLRGEVPPPFPHQMCIFKSDITYFIALIRKICPDRFSENIIHDYLCGTGRYFCLPEDLFILVLKILL